MTTAVVNPRKITYQPLKNWKYRLTQDHLVYINVVPPRRVEISYYDDPMISLEVDGLLTIRAGYCWDGPSGPTVDTPNFMRGSLYHDVMYQFMRAGLLPKDPYKEVADRLLQEVCREDGMSAFRAWYVYWGVRIGGGSACEPGYDPINEEIVAP